MKLRLILLLALAAAANHGRAAEPTAPPAAAVPAPAAPVQPRNAVPALAAAAPRNESSIAPTATIDAFRLITDRNIFNPNRTGRRDRGADDAPPRLDVIALVGTIDSDKGLRAIFDGTNATFRKGLRVGESVDQFKVTQIAPEIVNLERDGKTVAMRVGQQFRRPEGGDWNLIGAEVVRSEAAAAAASANAGKIDPTAQQAIPADASPALRALLERRNNSLKK